MSLIGHTYSQRDCIKSGGGKGARAVFEPITAVYQLNGLGEG